MDPLQQQESRMPQPAVDPFHAARVPRNDSKVFLPQEEAESRAGRPQGCGLVTLDFSME